MLAAAFGAQVIYFLITNLYIRTHNMPERRAFWRKERRRLDGLIFGTFVANELTPVVAWYYWLLATGGPMQPIALAIGALLARGD